MGSSPTSQLLNQPHLKPDLPRTLHFPESVHFLFNLNQLRSKFSITYIPKNLDSFMGPWQGFCLTQLWGGEGRVWIQCRQPGHPRSLGPLNPLLTLAAPPPLTIQFSNHFVWNPSRPPLLLSPFTSVATGNYHHSPYDVNNTRSSLPF